MTFSFLMYLLYHKFLKKSIKKIGFFIRSSLTITPVIYLIGEFHETRCPSQIGIL